MGRQQHAAFEKNRGRRKGKKNTNKVREEKADKSGVMDGKWMLLIRGSLAA
jgi:hypothetical protein